MHAMKGALDQRVTLVRSCTNNVIASGEAKMRGTKKPAAKAAKTKTVAAKK